MGWLGLFGVYERAIYACLVLFIVVAPSWAAPNRPADYHEVRGGLVVLTDGSIVEGSTENGGSHPGFHVRLSAPQLKELLDECRGVGERAAALWTKVDQIARLIMRRMTGGEDHESYPALLAEARARGGTVPLDKFVGCGAGMCRENALLLHFGLLAADIPNRLAYGQVHMPGGFEGDHAFVVLRHGGTLLVADSFFHREFHRQPLSTLFDSGKLLRLNTFPRYWIPQKRWKQLTAPVSSRVSFEQFRALVLSAAKDCEPLAKLWEWSQAKGVPVYLGGGLVRGILHWVSEGLKTNTPEEMETLALPPLEELLLQGKADFDLYAPADKLERLKREVPEIAEWDVVSLESFQESARAGGTTLDKTLLAPETLLDPHSGLRDYYEGMLRYLVVDEKERSESYWFRKMGNSEMAMALRFLRILVDMPELAPAPDTEDTMRALVARSAGKLGPQYGRWINKGLGKLFSSFGNDALSATRLLARWGFLLPLAEAGYTLPVVVPYEKLSPLLRTESFDDKERSAARRLLGGKQLHEIRRQAQRATSPAELLHALDSRWEAWSDARRERLAALYIEMIPRFIELQPSIGDVRRWKGQTPDIRVDIALLDALIPLATTAADVLELLVHPDYSELGPESKAALDEMMARFAAHFCSLKPTVDEALRWISYTASVSARLAVANATLPLASDAADALALLDLRSCRIGEADRARIEAVHAEHSGRFLDLRPTEAELSQWRKAAGFTGVAAMFRARLRQFSTVAEFVGLFSVEMANSAPSTRPLLVAVAREEWSRLAANALPSDRSVVETMLKEQRWPGYCLAVVAERRNH